MSTHKKTDPTDALFGLLDSGELGNFIPETFFGRDATFVAAVESERGKEVVRRLEEIDQALISLESFESGPRWEILKAMANIRAGKTIHVKDTVDAFARLPPESPKDCSPEQHEEDYYAPVINKYMPSQPGSREKFAWTSAYWQFFAAVADLVSREAKAKPPHPFEATPLVIAHKSVGWVVNLFVEARPGPPGMITPDWWKLGLMPLGENNELLTAIHDGFQAAYHEYGGSERIQLRWWLERHPNTKERLFDTITEARSVQVAAACAARAILEQEQGVSRPLLDTSVAVSGMLGSASEGTAFDKRTVGVVTLHQGKINGAQEAGLVAVLFSADSDMKLFTPETSLEKPGILVQPVMTLDDAYDNLLVTSKAIGIYKAKIVDEWSGENGKWIEQETPEAYRNASEKSTS